MKFQSTFLTLSLFVGSYAMSAGKSIYLDVRTKAEWDEKHIDKAKLIDINGPTFKEQISKLDKGASYEVFCRSGNRASKALDIMKDMGFKDVKNIGSVEDAVKVSGEPCRGSKC